jgi:hypothetical protein
VEKRAFHLTIEEAFAMKRFVGLLGLVLAVSLSAAAQDEPKAVVFGGYSYLRFNPGNGAQGVNFNGGVGSLAYNLTNHIGVVGEFAGYHNGNVQGSGVSVNALTYLFGPKISMTSGKITPFAQVLFGGARGSASATVDSVSVSVSENAFAVAAGGGLDYNATRHIGVRLGQIEYLMTRFNNTTVNGIGNGGTGTQNNFRYSAGVVFRF